MASFTVRNVTINTLTLRTIERFQAPPRSRGPFAKLGQSVTGLLTWSETTAAFTAPAEGQEPCGRQEIESIIARPFETRAITGTRAPEPGCEVLRLTFQTPGTEHRYVVDCPGSSSRSQVMRQLGGAPLELMAVYRTTARGGQLTVFSSAALASWMGELRDEYPLSMLSIPGTHNSPTCYVALPSVRCQAVGLREQLDNGVRFLDVRVNVNRSNDELALVHSVFPISLTGTKYFGDMVRDELYAFLDANPTETLLLCVKREGTGKGTDKQLSQYLFRRYCGGDEENARRWFTEPRIPSLGEARGKIVLMRRFDVDEALQGEHDGEGWGLDAAAWPDNCADEPTGSGMMRVQDFYTIYQSSSIEKKIELARYHLERACQQTFAEHMAAQGQGLPGSEPPPLFINFLSASNFFNANCWPEKIAAEVNPAIVDYLCTRHAEKDKDHAQVGVGDAGTGIVVSDWVGQDGDWDLIRCIVGWNARLQLKVY